MKKIFTEQFILYELHKGNILVNQKFKMAKYLISAKSGKIFSIGEKLKKN